MALSFVASIAESASATIPYPAGWAAGDIAIILAFRWNSAAGVDLATGFTNIATNTGNGVSSRVGYRVLQGGDTAGPWTNATDGFCLVYRGQHATPIGTSSFGQGTGTTLTFSALTLDAGGANWAVAMADQVSDTNLNADALSGMTNRMTGVTEAGFHSGHDTAAGVTSYAGGTQTIVSGGWHAYTIELVLAAVGGTSANAGVAAGVGRA